MSTPIAIFLDLGRHLTHIGDAVENNFSPEPVQGEAGETVASKSKKESR